jgi:hypothetical protein
MEPEKTAKIAQGAGLVQAVRPESLQVPGELGIGRFRDEFGVGVGYHSLKLSALPGQRREVGFLC